MQSFLQGHPTGQALYLANISWSERINSGSFLKWNDVMYSLALPSKIQVSRAVAFLVTFRVAVETFAGGIHTNASLAKQPQVLRKSESCLILVP